MKKPTIGLNCDIEEVGGRKRLFLQAAYFDAVARAGGVPLLIPFLEDPADIEQAIDHVDALLLTGGQDLDPSVYGAEAHPLTRPARFDLASARAALARRIPVLGICMGTQLLNVAAGGTLLQDIESEGRNSLQHRQSDNDREVHEVRISADSHLARIIGPEPLDVNSTHHQAIDAVAPGFEVCATAPDGVIEAIERSGASLVLGVQWHPERMLQHARHLELFRALVRQARSGSRASGANAVTNQRTASDT